MCIFAPKNADCGYKYVVIYFFGEKLIQRSHFNFAGSATFWSKIHIFVRRSSLRSQITESKNHVKLPIVWEIFQDEFVDPIQG